MRCPPIELDLEPEHTAFRYTYLKVALLTDYHIVWTPQLSSHNLVNQYLTSSGCSPFLIRNQMNPHTERQIKPLHYLKQVDHYGAAGLHITGASTIDLAIFDFWFPRVFTPSIRLSYRYHVQVSIENDLFLCLRVDTGIDYWAFL